MSSTLLRRAALLLAGSLAAAASPLSATAQITVVNTNQPGVGFNDPTAATPVGGNAGTTVGQQRLNAFQYAADLWASLLTSDVEIRIAASFTSLTCSATSGVLGSAGPTQIVSDFDSRRAISRDLVSDRPREQARGPGSPAGKRRHPGQLQLGVGEDRLPRRNVLVLRAR